MTYGEREAQMQMILQPLYGTGEAAAITDWVFEELTGNNRRERKQRADTLLSPDLVVKLERATAQLLQHQPVQYVLGYAWFFGMKFKVNGSVLIPRPETEELVEWIVQEYKRQVPPLKLLDIGTGSGCIAVALKKQVPGTTVSAIDISNEALQTAARNASDNGTSVHFLQMDFLDETAWQQLPQYGVIVSNPPYIPAQEKTTMDRNVTDWEPGTALFVPDETPLLFYEKIAAFGKKHLLPGGTVFMETHRDYASAVQQLFTQHGYAAILKKDMHGNERMVKAVIADN